MLGKSKKKKCCYFIVSSIIYQKHVLNVENILFLVYYISIFFLLNTTLSNGFCFSFLYVNEVLLFEESITFRI